MESVPPLILREYQTTREVHLSQQEVDSLRLIAPSVSVAPSVGHEGHYDLTPGSWVGAVNLGSRQLEIRPKLPIRSLLFMLSYSLDPRRWEQNPFDFTHDTSLLEAVIPGFVVQVRRALYRGVLQGYRAEESALATVRGRVRFADQIRDHFGLFPPVEVRYDEFTEDVEENRLLKAAIFTLGHLRIRSEEARRSLRVFDSALEMVSPVHYDPRRLPDVTYTRLNEHYRPAVELAKLILRFTSFEARHGRVRASAFLVDMNEVFEDFVVVALREALGVGEREFPQGARGRRLRLDEAGAVRLQPDISWWDGSNCTFVGDIKYKRVDVAGVLHPDLYQLLAYTIATDLPGGLLIYAAGEAETVTHQVVRAGKELQVVTLDLAGTPSEVLRQVREVAQKTLRLRQTAVLSKSTSGYRFGSLNLTTG